MSRSTRTLSWCAAALALALVACQGGEQRAGGTSDSASGTSGGTSGSSTSGMTTGSTTGGAETTGGATTGVPLETCSYAVTPSSVDFGSLDVGQTSNPATVALQNLGATNCIVDWLSITDDATDSFHILSVTPQPAVAGLIVVPPGSGTAAELTTMVDFAPTSGANALAANVTMSLRDPTGIDRTVVVPLSGNVPPPDLSHCLVGAPRGMDMESSSEPDSGAICTAASREFSLFNQCTTSIVVHSIEIQDSSGAPDTQFELLYPPAMPFTLSAGSPSLILTLDYQPTEPGPQAASLVISWGPPSTPEIVVPLSGHQISTGSETDTFTATDALTYDLVGTPLGGAGGMSVTIGATHVPSLAGTSAPNWTYDAASNAVTLTARVYLRAGQIIAVTYPIGCK